MHTDECNKYLDSWRKMNKHEMMLFMLLLYTLLMLMSIFKQKYIMGMEEV